MKITIPKYNPLLPALVLTLIIIATLGVIGHSRANEIDHLKKQNRELHQKLTRIQVRADAAETKVTNCEADLNIAWQATKRRNDLLTDVLGNLFSGDNSSRILADNSQLYDDFESTTDCTGGMTYTDVFAG